MRQWDYIYSLIYEWPSRFLDALLWQHFEFSVLLNVEGYLLADCIEIELDALYLLMFDR